MILLIQVQLAMVYFFAGLAKLNTDWMVDFMPMAVWLPAKGDLPLIGPILAKPITAAIFSYGGAFYDLSIAFFLFLKGFLRISVISFTLPTISLSIPATASTKLGGL